MAAVVGVTLTAKDLGISYSISTGNKAANGVEDYTEYLLEDPSTQVVALIVEQFRRPQRFLALARRARTRGKTMSCCIRGAAERRGNPPPPTRAPWPATMESCACRLNAGAC